MPIPSEARECLDRYIEKKRGQEPGPLFLGRYGERLTTQAIALICARLSEQPSPHLPEEEQFKLPPHNCRHHCSKRIADKHGVHPLSG